ncbi:MAG TPA: hypothetical protein P5065_05670 [Candidatus Ratteibacteria bacterium]|nr:hypothetical protein [bacterium]HPC29697.1 hypothetical protein [bacterium]HRS06509.1 hypothetical protein [Candidatus Ratteibacteria bacterium]HRV04616.1 hypothetical protein [Candidatus Ratteibacteria bacterium]
MRVNLKPAPENDFPLFIKTYYDECKTRFSKIEAIAGKWEFEDLIPGLSDFDSRYICSDDMTSSDWCKMSMVVGQVHLDLCSRFPQWIRILEHLPGINLTWNEFEDEFTYYPEYKQWSFYHTSNQHRLNKAISRIESRTWDKKDEYFHLKKFLAYYCPYDRKVDIPINLDGYLDKYLLHSRVMHYFNPPVQSAVSLIHKKTIRGKKESFRIADRLFFDSDIFREILNLIDSHYERPSLYEEGNLSLLEGRMFAVLKKLSGDISKHLFLILDPKNTGIQEWKNHFRDIKMDPALVVFENAKFSRLMKGRLYFYVSAPEYFDNIALIRNELNRIGKNFFREPFSIYWQLETGEKIEDPSIILNNLSNILNKDEIDCTLKFDKLTKLDYTGREKEIARSIIDVYDGFYCALHKITEQVKSQVGKNENKSVSL